MIKEQCKLLASVAVVREFYDNNMGVYDVLKEFVKYVLVKDGKEIVSAESVTTSLNEKFGFNLPSPTIKPCLKNLKGVVKHGKDTFQCNLNVINSQIPQNINVDTSISDYEKRNELLFSSLYISYAEANKKDSELTDIEKKVIKNSFCDFLIDDRSTSPEEAELFSRFILKVSGDENLYNIFMDLKEGMILYEGMCYCGDLNTLGSWHNDLTIICDTEILFSMCGYNSKLSQELYIQLEKYVNEINRKNKNGKKIRFAYFSETKEEIDYSFNKAEQIVLKHDILDPSKEAIAQIVKDCKTKGDVATKRASFYAKLQSKNVHVYEYNFYNLDDESNKLYNLESLSILSTYSSIWQMDNNDVLDSARLLSHISILRKNNDEEGIENSKYIFLTATGRTLRLAKTKDFFENRKNPLATTYDFLINYFWFKLNKGFGNSNSPRTLDMVLKSQTVLANIYNSKTSEKFSELLASYNSVQPDGTQLDKKYFEDVYVHLRDSLKKPEDINTDTISDEIDYMENFDLNEAIENSKRRDQEYINQQEELKALKEQLLESASASASNKKNLTHFQNKLNESTTTNNELRNENKQLKAELAGYKQKEKEANQKKEDHKKIFDKIKKYTFIVLRIAIFIICGVCAYKSDGFARVASGLGLPAVIISCFSKPKEFLGRIFGKIKEKIKTDKTDKAA